MQSAKIVIGNWKMNGNLALVKSWSNSLKNWLKKNPQNQNKIGVCPSYPYLDAFRQNIQDSDLFIGAQDVSEHDNGAYSSEISAQMLQEMNCQYCIIGHCEARSYLKQTDSQIRAKLSQLIKYQIIPILCVGESLALRQQNQAEAFVLNQIDLATDKINIKKMIIAYEPVWAIGTGKTATAEIAQKMHQSIKNLCQKKMPNTQISIIYGGSVNEKNAADLFSMPNIDGALVGGASLDPTLFIKICGAGNYV